MAYRKFIPVSAKPFTWIDTETTGLDDQKNDIIEFAAVRINPDGTETVLHLYIDIERPGSAHPRALEVNGYTPESWKEKGAIAPTVAWRQVADSGILSDCIIAGQNVRFDAGFLNATFERHGIDYRMDYHLYDTCTLALEHLKPWLESISLTPICVALGIPVRDAHTALADTRLAMAVGEKLRQATADDRQRWGQVIPGRLKEWFEAGRPADWPLV